MPDPTHSTPSAEIVQLRNRMSEQDYDAERAQLKATYGESNVEAAAKRDQALARLFDRSGWTQQELAEKEGKTQPWIARCLLFGRFLNFMPMGIKVESLPANLSERKFRALWEKTDPTAAKDEFRFRAVLKALQSEATMAPRRPPIGTEIVEKFADGKWHSVQAIVNKVEQEFEHVRNTLEGMTKNQTYGVKTEKRTPGLKTLPTSQFRIFKPDKMISSSELIEKLTPILKGLEEQGRASAAAAAPQVVRDLAYRLRKLLEEWTQ